MKKGDKVYLRKDSYWFKDNQGQDSYGNPIEGEIIESGSSFQWKVLWNNGAEYYYDTKDLELSSSSNNYEIY